MSRCNLVPACLLALVAVSACGGPPVVSSPDVAAAALPDASSCAYPCGKACCTKSQTCDFESETCADKCVPDCNGRSCGSDGCDDVCGYCDPGTVCNEGAGKCVLCNRDCAGKQCGPDGCGSTCGTCDDGFACAADNLCRKTTTTGDAGPVAATDSGTATGLDGSVVEPTPDTGTVAGVDGGTVISTPDTGTSPGLDAGTPVPADASLPRPDASVGPGSDAGAGYCIPPVPTYNPNFSASQYCDQWARVVCDRLAQCCILSPAAYDDCVQYKSKECDTQDVTARIQAGTVTLNLAAAKACFDAERARKACDANAYSMILPACDWTRVLSANAAPGARCYRDSDCVNGHCPRTPGTCDGVCAAYTPIGGSCSATAPCDPKTARCQSGLCSAKVATGASCADTGGCLQTDYCDNVAKVCIPRRGLGGSCADGSQCLTELYCVGGVCREDYSVPVGAACKTTSACVVGSWCKGATSTTTGTCTAPTAPGGACTAGTTVECGPDGYCLAGTCIARLGMGEACSGGSCRYGLTCSGSRCVLMGDVGASCSADSQCRRYLRCANNLCTDALATVGSACSNTPQCDDGYCPSSTCLQFVADGQACTSDVSCASGNCETNATVKSCRPKCTY
ncbi:MAG: hypothetical protein QM765_20475 [Myxococcales bacterium]